MEVKLARYDQAIDHYQQALDTIEGLRAGLDSKETKSTYMKNKLFVYDELIELLRSLHGKDPVKAMTGAPWRFLSASKGASSWKRWARAAPGTSPDCRSR